MLRQILRTTARDCVVDSVEERHLQIDYQTSSNLFETFFFNWMKNIIIMFGVIFKIPLFWWPKINFFTKY